MNADVFFDTNVLVYAAIGTGRDELKRQRALELIDSEYFGTSAQVLQEFYVTVVKKAARPITANEALAWIEQLLAFPCLPVDAQVVKIAIEVSERYRVSYWDAGILVAAEALGTHTVFSEDLSHTQRYGKLKVINPFA